MTSELFPELPAHSVRELLRNVPRLSADRVDTDVLQKLQKPPFILVQVQEHDYVFCAYKDDYDFLEREKLDCDGRVEIKSVDKIYYCDQCGQPMGDVNRKHKFREYEISLNLEGIKQYVRRALRHLGVVNDIESRKGRAYVEVTAPGGQKFKIFFLDFIGYPDSTELAMYFTISSIIEESATVIQSISLADFLSKPKEEIKSIWNESAIPLLGILQPTKLLTILDEYFNLGEFKELCFKLPDVDYDNISGNTKREKAQELITYLERRGQLSALVRLIRQDRPDIDLPAQLGVV